MNRDRRVARMAWGVYNQPDLDRLDAIIRDLSHGAIRLYQVDTGTPIIEIILSDTDLDDEHIAAAHTWNPDQHHPAGIFTIPADATIPTTQGPASPMIGRRRSPAEQHVWLDQLERDANLPGHAPEGSTVARWRRMTPDARAFARALIDDAYDEPDLDTPIKVTEYIRDLIEQHALNHPTTRLAYDTDPTYRNKVSVLGGALIAARDAMHTCYFGMPAYAVEAVLIRTIVANIGPRALARAQAREALGRELRHTFDLIDETVDAMVTPEAIEEKLAELKATTAPAAPQDGPQDGTQ